jgi:hemoglobin-like flavoprotein
MTEDEIILVQRTWKIFRCIEPRLVGDVFYSKLFMMQSDLRKMFPATMEHQYKKLTDMISTIVARLDKPDEIAEDIAALGRRHAGYGVKPQHYKLVGKALLWTLQQGLGNDWTKEVEAAWIKCYAFLSNTMVTAAMEQKQQSKI